MYGALLGDMIGAPYEFDRGDKTKDFPLFIKTSHFTDDSVMTIAVAQALMDSYGKREDKVRKALVSSMQEWGHRYPDAGYGGMFYRWLGKKDPKPYGSFGNGSAMRVSSAGWLYDSLEETRKYARLTAEVTHNHPEGIKGAEAVASAIYLARRGYGKKEIKEYISREFSYDLSRSCDEIRPGYHFMVTCQETVPEAVTAFLEGEDFEDVIRTAVSLGGDCDTLTCIAGSIAEAFYGVPEELKEECRKRIGKDMLAFLDYFDSYRERKMRTESVDQISAGNEMIEWAIEKFHAHSNEDSLLAVLEAIRHGMHACEHLLLPINLKEEEDGKSYLRTIVNKDGKVYYPAFTSQAEFQKGPESKVISNDIGKILKACLDQKEEGMVLNPWGKPFILNKERIKRIFELDKEAEDSVADGSITAELLEDGSYLKNAVDICRKNRTQLNLIRLTSILRDSWVWIPCTAILSDTDYDALEKVVFEARDKGDLDSLIGLELTNQDHIRLVPDILQGGEEYFLPVFTSDEEMGEYGEAFSHIEKPFLEAIILAKNNEKNVSGIVVNPFSGPMVIPMAILEVIEKMDSALD